MLLAVLAASTLLVHLRAAFLSVYGPAPYGLHRDEYLYLALGRHLDWVYLEVPPGIALLAAALQVTVGTSLVAVRLVPALASAGLAALIAPVYLRAGTLFQPVIFDQRA